MIGIENLKVDLKIYSLRKKERVLLETKELTSYQKRTLKEIQAIIEGLKNCKIDIHEFYKEINFYSGTEFFKCAVCGKELSEKEFFEDNSKANIYI